MIARHEQTAATLRMQLSVDNRQAARLNWNEQPTLRPQSSRRSATGSLTTSLVQANRCQDWATHMTQDWWIRRKIQTEQLGGLGPPAIMLRIENAELDSRLDGRSSEDDVRELVADFNRRVIEARRQLLGRPPVVTPTRDIEAELSAWHERRQQRQADEREQWGAGKQIAHNIAAAASVIRVRAKGHRRGASLQGT